MGGKQSKATKKQKKAQKANQKTKNKAKNNTTNPTSTYQPLPDRVGPIFNPTSPPRRIASPKQLSNQQLKEMLSTCTNNRGLPHAIKTAATNRFNELHPTTTPNFNASITTISVTSMLSSPEFAHPLHRRLIETVIDVMEGKTIFKSNPLDWSNSSNAAAKRSGGRKRNAKSFKSNQFYGTTFTIKAPLGLKLIPDPAATSSPTMGKLGVVVSAVGFGKLASQDGAIQPGDTLVSVNGTFDIMMMHFERKRFFSCCAVVKFLF